MIATRVLLALLTLLAVSQAQESLPAAPSAALSAPPTRLLAKVELPALRPPPLIVERNRKTPVVNRTFVAWTLADGATIAADAITTVHCLSLPNCVEKNPLFGSHPSPLRVAGTESAFFATDTLLSYWLKRKGKSWWWVPAAANTAQGAIAAGLNLRHW